MEVAATNMKLATKGLLNGAVTAALIAVQPPSVPELVPSPDDSATANGCIATVSKLRHVLGEADTIKEIRVVENFAQRARDTAQTAKLSRQAVNVAARLLSMPAARPATH